MSWVYCFIALTSPVLGEERSFFPDFKLESLKLHSTMENSALISFENRKKVVGLGDRIGISRAKIFAIQFNKIFLEADNLIVSISINPKGQTELKRLTKSNVDYTEFKEIKSQYKKK